MFLVVRKGLVIFAPAYKYGPNAFLLTLSLIGDNGTLGLEVKFVQIDGDHQQ